jgi:hypothetical protein
MYNSNYGKCYKGEVNVAVRFYYNKILPSQGTQKELPWEN